MEARVQLDYGFVKSLEEAMRRHGLQAKARRRNDAYAVANISFCCTHHHDQHPSAFLTILRDRIRIHCSVCTSNLGDLEKAQVERAIYEKLPPEVKEMIADYVVFSDTPVSNGKHHSPVPPAAQEDRQAWTIGSPVDAESLFSVDESFYEDSAQYLSERLCLRKDYILERISQIRTARNEPIVSFDRYALRFNFDSKACVKLRAASHERKKDRFRFLIDERFASEKDYLLWPSPLSLRSFARRNQDGTYTANVLVMTEGELDALATMLIFGVPAVSPTIGGGAKTETLIDALRHYVTLLSVRSFIIIGDEDSVGKRFTKEVRKVLEKELNVSVLILPASVLFGGSQMYKKLHTELAEHYEIQSKTKDLVDYFSWLAKNRDIYKKKFIGEAIFTLNKAYNALTKLSDETTNFVQLRKPSKKHNEVGWIIEGMLARNEYMLISGHAKVGKSLIGMHIANRLVHGLPLFGHQVPANLRVAYLDAENSEAVKFRRMHKNDLHNAESFNFVYNSDGLGLFNLQNHDQVSELFAALIKSDVDVLIVDTLSSLISGEDDNNKKYADIILSFITQARKLGITVIAITHNNKYAEQDSVVAVKGTTNIAAQADTILLCRKVKADDGFHYLLIDRLGRHEEDSAAHKYLVRFDAGKAVAYMDDEIAIALEIERLGGKNTVVDKTQKEKRIEEAFMACIDSKKQWNTVRKNIKDWLKEHYGLSVKDIIIEEVFNRLKAEGFLRDERLDGKHYVWIEKEFQVEAQEENNVSAYKEIEYKITAEAESEADLFEAYMAKYSEIEPYLLPDDGDDDGGTGGDDEGDGDGGTGGDDDGGDDGGGDGGGGQDGGGDDEGGSDSGQDGGNRKAGLVFDNWLDVFEYLRKARQASIFEQEAETGLLAQVEDVDVYYERATQVDMNALREALFCDTRVGVDIEMAGDRIVLMALAFEAGKKVLVIYNDDDKRLAEIVREVLVLSYIAGHNLSFDLKHMFGLLEEHGMQVDKLDIVQVHDTLVFEKFISRQLTIKRVGDKVIEDEGSYALSDLMERYFGVAMEKSYRNEFSGIITSLHVLYNAMDALATLRIYERQKPHLRNEYVAANIKKVFASVVYMAYASARGFRFNTEAFAEHKRLVEEDVAKAMKALNDAFEADERKERVYELYLQGHRSLPAPDKRWRNAGFIKAFFKAIVDADIEDASLDTAKLYSGTDALVDLYLRFAEADSRTKQLTTLEKHIKGGRLRGDFVTLGAITGRMRSKEPNMQNISKENRRFMEADDDEHCLILYDFSNIEMRLAASIYNDATLKDIFNNGGDAHKLLASKIYGKSQDEITKEERQIAKMVNFASLYGTSPKTLRSILLAANPAWKDKISLEDAKKFLDAFFDTYKGIARIHEYGKRFVDKHMDSADQSFTVYVRLLNHVTYKVEGMKADEYRRRRLLNQLLNIVIQGAAAAGLYETLHRFHRKLYEAGYKVSDAYVVACVHDEIVVHVRKDIADKVAALLVAAAKEAFNDVVDVVQRKPLLCEVPMDGELRISRNFRGGEEDKV